MRSPRPLTHRLDICCRAANDDGVIAVLIVPGLRGVSISLLGVSCILGAAISWAGGTIVMKYFRWSMSTLLLTGWQILIGGIPIAVGALVLEPVAGLAQVSWKAMLVMGYTIFLGIIFGQWAWFKVVDLFPASVAAIGSSQSGTAEAMRFRKRHCSQGDAGLPFSSGPSPTSCFRDIYVISK